MHRRLQDYACKSPSHRSVIPGWLPAPCSHSALRCPPQPEVGHTTLMFKVVSFSLSHRTLAQEMGETEIVSIFSPPCHLPGSYPTSQSPVARLECDLQWKGGSLPPPPSMGVGREI